MCLLLSQEQTLGSIFSTLFKLEAIWNWRAGMVPNRDTNNCRRMRMLLGPSESRLKGALASTVAEMHQIHIYLRNLQGDRMTWVRTIAMIVACAFLTCEFFDRRRANRLRQVFHRRFRRYLPQHGTRSLNPSRSRPCSTQQRCLANSRAGRNVTRAAQSRVTHTASLRKALRCSFTHSKIIQIMSAVCLKNAWEI